MTGHSARCGEVTYTAVVPKKRCTRGQTTSQLHQWKAVPVLDMGSANLIVHAAFALGLASDKDDVLIVQFAYYTHPVIEGPVLADGSTARMNSYASAPGLGIGQYNAGHRNIQIHGKTFQRLRELESSMTSAINDPMRGIEKGLHTDALHVVAQVTIWIVEIANDDVEALQPIGEGFLNGRSRHKQERHTTVIKTADGVGKAGRDRQTADTRIAQDFQAATGYRFTQQPDRWKRDDEIANRSTANDQNGRHGHSIPEHRRD